MFPEKQFEDFCEWMWHSNKASRDRICDIKSNKHLFEAALEQDSDSPHLPFISDSYVFEFIEDLGHWLDYTKEQEFLAKGYSF